MPGRVAPSLLLELLGESDFDGTPGRPAGADACPTRRDAGRRPAPVNGRRGAGVPARRRGSAGVDVRGERADERQVAVALGVVEAVADDELVGDVEADVAHVDVDLGRLRLAQQGADLDRGRAARRQVGQQPGQGQARSR